MDGLEERLRYSIQWRLSLRLSLAIAIAAMGAGAYAFVGGFQEANELQDDGLRQVAVLVAHQPSFERALATLAKDADPDSNLTVQSLGDGAQGGADDAALAIPVGVPDGLQTIVLNSKSYRSLVTTLPDARRFAVSQETRDRDEIAVHAAFRSLLPWLIAVPFLIVIVTQLVRTMLAPIARLAGEIDRRGDQELHPLQAQDVPLEIRPFVVSIDRLLGRVARAMDAQRRFVADAAHELRSPLAALSLQAERLDATQMSSVARGRLRSLRAGMERGRHLLDQMLDFARAQSGAGAKPGGVLLSEICRRVLEDLMPLAEAKGIDIGMTPGAFPRVAACESDATAIVRNLVDNAIRYVPAGGRVDLSLSESGGRALLRIEDDGPGIPFPERQRVLDPFYRVLGTGESGSGLGLSIVDALVARLNGALRLGDATSFQHGLQVTVSLPSVSATPEIRNPPATGPTRRTFVVVAP